MGLFDKSKKEAVDPSQAGTATYVNMEQGEMPIAAAVVEEDPKKGEFISAEGVEANGSQLIFVTRRPTTVPQCPFCKQVNARTRITTSPSILTFLSSALIFGVVGYFLRWFIALCTFWIPFVVDRMRNTTHYCTTCNSELGSISPLKDCCVKHR